jgi:hypothetical protein
LHTKKANSRDPTTRNQAELLISKISKNSKVTLYYAKVTKAQTNVMENLQNDKFFVALNDHDSKKITYFVKRCEEQHLMQEISLKLMKTILQVLPSTREGTISINNSHCEAIDTIHCNNKKIFSKDCNGWNLERYGLDKDMLNVINHIFGIASYFPKFYES